MTRTIYALADENTESDKSNWIEIHKDICGFRPLKRDFVQVWCTQQHIKWSTYSDGPFRINIYLEVWKDKTITAPNGETTTVAQHIQNLCASCCYGETYKTK